MQEEAEKTAQAKAAAEAETERLRSRLPLGGQCRQFHRRRSQGPHAYNAALQDLGLYSNSIAEVHPETFYPDSD